MKLIDEHYKKLPIKKKEFLAFIITGFLITALLGHMMGAISGFESLLLFIIGVLFMSAMKQEFRIEDLEKDLKKK